MELIRKNIHFNKMTKEAKNQITLEEDVNLPDTKEDAKDILFHNYRVVIDDVKTGDKKVHILGKILYSILYRSEESGRLCSMDGSIPINEQLYMDGVRDADKVTVKARVEDFSVGIINSRKISIRSILDLYAYVQELYDEQITTGVENVECEMLHKDCRFSQLTVCKKDIFRFRESVTIPNNMPNIEDIVFCSIKLWQMECKPMDGQLAVQGKVQVCVIYDGERGNYNQIYQTVVPFSTMLDCSGSNINANAAVAYDILDSQIHMDTDYDGEARNFLVELVLELDMKLYDTQKVDAMWDLYGIQNELTPAFETISYDVLSAQQKGVIHVTDKIVLSDDDHVQTKILWSEGKSYLEKCQITEEGLEMEGVMVCQLLYADMGQETDYGSSQFAIPFHKTIELSGVVPGEKENIRYDIWLGCPQLQFAFDMNGKWEVNANVEYEALIFEKAEGRNITDVTIEEMDAEKYNNLPSIAVCFAKHGDTLWEMGKKYCVTRKQIRDMNNLASDELSEGEKILIVRGAYS